MALDDVWKCHYILSRGGDECRGIRGNPLPNIHTPSNLLDGVDGFKGLSPDRAIHPMFVNIFQS